MNKVGIDIGATSTRIAVLNEKNKLLKREKFTTDVNDFAHQMDEISKIINQMETQFGPIKRIGICAPGPLDLKEGRILNAPNLPGWRNLNIVDQFQQMFAGSKEIHLDNDANVAALGQFLTYPTAPHSLYYVTVSSGIGSGFIYQGEIFHGYNYTATEIFNSLPSLTEDKNPSQTGIEYFASGNNIPKVLKERGIDVKDATQAFQLRTTNKGIEDYFVEYKKRMAAFLATAIYFYNPQYLVIGGSVALKNQDFFKEIINYTYQITSHLEHKTTIEFAKDLEEQTLKGAANL